MIDIGEAWFGDNMKYAILDECFSLICSELFAMYLTAVVGSPTPMSNFTIII